MNDRFRKSAPPTDGMAPGPLTTPWQSAPNAQVLARLLGPAPGEEALEGLKPYDDHAAPGSPPDGGRVTPIRPAIPDDLDRAFRELPAGETDLFGADGRPGSTREDEGTAVDARRPGRWRGIARTFALASVLLVLSPFVTTYPYRRLAEAFLELSSETVAQAASNVRDAIPAVTQSFQAHWPNAWQAGLSNVEWLTAWLEPPSAPSQATGAASAVAAPAAMSKTAAPSDLGQVARPTRLELASVEPLFPERPDAVRGRQDLLVLPSDPDLGVAAGTGSDIILSAGPEALESPPANVAPDATAPANAGITQSAPASSDAAAVAETRPLPAESSAAPLVAPINPTDLDALLEKLLPVPSPGTPDRPADAAALPTPRLDVPGSPDPGAEPGEAQARERKEALDRDRERADALVRELAGLRDAIDAMKSRNAPTVTNAPASPLVPVPPAPSAPMQAPQPAPMPMPVASPMPVAAPVPATAPVPVAAPTPVTTPIPAPAPMPATVQIPAPIPTPTAAPVPVTAPVPVAAPIPAAAPMPDPVRVVPTPPPTEQVRLDPPQPVAPPQPVSRLPDNAAPSPRPPTPQAVVQSPATPSIAPNEQRLIERAEALLKLYDISGARLILDRAMTAGSARAAHLLAQTYDPRILDEWRVVGIKGDPAKAEELYARARAGGIREAGQRRP